MTVQFNSDKTIQWDQRHTEHFTALVKEELGRFSDHITRVEAHFSDQNGAKEGVNDIRCLLEVRVEGKKPIATSHQADKIEQAISGALEKMKAALKSNLDRSHK